VRCMSNGRQVPSRNGLYSQEELFLGRKRPPGFANIQPKEPTSQKRFTRSVLLSRRCSTTVRTEVTATADDTDRTTRKRDLRSQQAKDRWRQQVANRREQIIQLLTANGFPYVSTHYCTAVDGFVRNLLNRSRVRSRRWTAEDVIRICCKRHMT
jgi:hypothetical protein